MSCRNIDFYAVCLSAFVLAGFSQVDNWSFNRIDPVRLQNAVTISSNNLQQGLNLRLDCLQKGLDQRINSFDSRVRKFDSHMREMDSRMRELDQRLSHF